MWDGKRKMGLVGEGMGKWGTLEMSGTRAKDGMGKGYWYIVERVG